MKARVVSLTLALTAALLASNAAPVLACAGCRNPSLVTTRGSEGALEAGAIRAGATLTGTTVHVVHEAGCADLGNCSEVPAQPLYLHDQNLYPAELRLSGEYGINRTFGVELQVPLRLVKTTIRYTTPDGQPYEPLDPGIHHRNEVVAGPADVWLLLRVGTLWNKWWLAARPGVSLPLGKTVENPFELGDHGLRHQHIQFGSGTFDPVLVLEASRSFKPITLEMFAQAQASPYENGHGYRAPWRASGGAAVSTKLLGNLNGALGGDMFHDDAERWDGNIRQDGSLGRTEILASAALRQTLGKGVLSLNVRVPLWREIVVGDEPPGTLSSPVILSFGYSHTFLDDDETTSTASPK
jgi:hypothetical protein